MASTLRSKLVNIFHDLAIDIIPEDRITTDPDTLHTIVHFVDGDTIDLDLVAEIVTEKLKRAREK